MFLSYITTESDGALTLDQLLRGPLSLSAREAREAKRLGLTVDGAPFFANQRVGAGRTIRVPLAEYDRPGDFSASGDIAVLYEDDALLAVRKPAPLQVHPSPSAPRGADTLEGRVQRYLHSGAHPVHRLDAETTGIVLFAKLPYAQAHIQRQMQADAFRKEYLAWVCGVPATPEGVIDAPIDRIAPDSFTRAVLPGGQRAVTRYRVEHICGDVSLVRFFPVTGRTPDARRHALLHGRIRAAGRKIPRPVSSAQRGQALADPSRHGQAASNRLPARFQRRYRAAVNIFHPLAPQARPRRFFLSALAFLLFPTGLFQNLETMMRQ